MKTLCSDDALKSYFSCTGLGTGEEGDFVSGGLCGSCGILPCKASEQL